MKNIKMFENDDPFKDDDWSEPEVNQELKNYRISFRSADEMVEIANILAQNGYEVYNYTDIVNNKEVGNKTNFKFNEQSGKFNRSNISTGAQLITLQELKRLTGDKTTTNNMPKFNSPPPPSRFKDTLRNLENGTPPNTPRVNPAPRQVAAPEPRQVVPAPIHRVNRNVNLKQYVITFNNSAEMVEIINILVQSGYRVNKQEELKRTRNTENYDCFTWSIMGRCFHRSKKFLLSNKIDLNKLKTL